MTRSVLSLLEAILACPQQYDPEDDGLIPVKVFVDMKLWREATQAVSDARRRQEAIILDGQSQVFQVNAALLSYFEDVNDLLCDGQAGEAAVMLGNLLDHCTIPVIGS